MRPSRIDNYDIDVNAQGDMMFSVADLEDETGAVEFDVDRSDCVLYFDDGSMVRLTSVPPRMLSRLRDLRSIVIAEYEKSGTPLRCYDCERAL